MTALLPRIRTPALVLLGRSDAVHPLRESMDMASAMPDARLAVLDTRNHVLVETEPAWHRWFNALRAFVE